MGEKQAVMNIIYSTKETPVDLNDDVDIKFAKENEVCRSLIFVISLTSIIRTFSISYLIHPFIDNPD